MRTTFFLGITFIYAQELFWNSRKITVDVDDRTKQLSKMPMEKNPIFLDSHLNGLVPNKILTTFINPNFTGAAPPGITTFMANQVLLQGEKKQGYVYPLFLEQALDMFSKDKMEVEQTCGKNSSGDKKCPAGYKKVIKNPKGEDPEDENKKEGGEQSVEQSKDKQVTVNVPSTVVTPTEA